MKECRDANDFFGIFGDFIDEGDEVPEPKPAQNSGGDTRTFGKVNVKKSDCGVRSDDMKTPDEKPDGDIRQYRRHERLRRPTIPREPAASKAPVPGRADRSLYEWLHGPNIMNSLTVESRAQDERERAWHVKKTPLSPCC